MKKIIVFLSLLLFFLGEVVLLTTSSYGQTYQTFVSEIKNINETAKLKFGPFRIFPAFQISNIGYDNNVYYRPASLEPIADYTATFGFRADIHFIFQNWLLFTFTENPAYLYFAEQKDQRYLNNNYAFNLRLLAFSRIVLSGTHRFGNERTLLSSEVTARVIHKTNENYGSIFYETPRNTSMGFTGGIREFKYEDTTVPGAETPVSISLNREERSALGEFYYRVFSDSNFFANFGYFENTFDYPQSKFRDSYAYQLYSGIRFPVLGRARGLLSLGYKKLVPRKKGLQGFSGIVGDTSFEIRIRRFNYRLEYSRDTPFSIFGNNIYFNQNRYGAGISFYLNQFIRLDYNFSRGENMYPELQLIVLPDGTNEEIKRKDIYDVHSGAIVIRIVKNTGIGLRADYWERKSNYPGANVHRFFAGGFLTYEF